MTADVAVQVDGLRVSRGGKVVLPGLTMSVPAGQVVGLLGPSGSGKSTLMRAIVGVQVVDGGTVTVLGEPAGSASLRGKVGYATQRPSVYEDLSIRDNLIYFGAIHQVGEAAVDDVLARVDLTAHAAKRCRNLSGGQLSRVNLAAALINAPSLLLLDEPTVGLDPVLRRELWDMFAELAASGTTLLVSSHVMDEATRCDRLLLLRAGHIIADTTYPDLLARTNASDAESAFLTLIEDAANPDEEGAA